MVAIAPVKPHVFTVDEYHRMAETGILARDARVELIDGEIVDMAPRGNLHQGTVDQLGRLFVMALGESAIVRVQGSVRLTNITEPEPDLLVLRNRADFYRGGSAGPEDVLLLIEVADSSLAWDRDHKGPIYARAGIPEYWIADLNGSRVYVYRDPTPAGFRFATIVSGTDAIHPLAFPAVTVIPAEIVGPFPGA